MTESSLIQARREADAYISLPEVPGISLPQPPGLPEDANPAPSLEECVALWDRHQMPPHIREHCRQVAVVLLEIGDLLIARGSGVSRGILLAGALLHDIAKMYTVWHGGDHARLGAAMMLRETKNYRVAQMIYHHVHWPWDLNVENDLILPAIMISYADKRVMHDRIVPLRERFADLRDRYGKTEFSLSLINKSEQQGLAIEQGLNKRLEVDLSEYPFDSGRLVAREGSIFERGQKH